jgi:histidine triad (HIT) family protein
MNIPDCVFCKFALHKLDNLDIFYEDEDVFVMLDRDWAVKGHSLVVWKEHVLNMSDLSREEFAHFSEVVRATEETLLNVLEKDKSIVLKSGGIVSHFHFHIYPVESTMLWEQILALFNKDIRNVPTEAEKEDLLATLQARFS